MKHVVTMQLERRIANRRKVNVGASLADDEDTAATVLVHNISVAGFRMVAAVPLTQGDALELELPRIGRHKATVVWQDGVSFGCTFDCPITASELAQIEESGAARQALRQERALNGWRPSAAELAA